VIAITPVENGIKVTARGRLASRRQTRTTAVRLAPRFLSRFWTVEAVVRGIHSRLGAAR
jgi:hypothetical protein